MAAYVWRIPEITETQGMIVESKRVFGRAGLTVTYEYTAYGVRHQTRRLFNYRPINIGRYDVGAPIPVYFVNDNPELNYAPNRPLVNVFLIWAATTFAFGLWIAFLSRSHN